MNEQQEPTGVNQGPQTPAAPVQSSEPDAQASPKPAKTSDTPWYLDPPKVVGVLGFVLAVGTLGERMWVRQQEETASRLQQLRDVTAELADIQAAYVELLAKPQPNTYALGVAMNTKRQMHLQTARALLAYREVTDQATAQILGTLANQVAGDGRYEEAKAFYEAALKAPGMDSTTEPYIRRSLAQLYRTPNTTFFSVETARAHFQEALANLEKRQDDAGHLTWAETVLSEAGVEVTFGDLERAKELAVKARERLSRVRTMSPLKAQLEQIASTFERGQQYPDTTTASVPQPMPVAPPQVTPRTDAPSANAPSITLTLWQVIPGQVSGAEFDVSVDGHKIGALSNLDDRLTVTTTLAPGIHHFSFTNMNAYGIEMTGARKQVAQNISCQGLFESSASTKSLNVNVGSGPHGLMCAVQ